MLCEYVCLRVFMRMCVCVYACVRVCVCEFDAYCDRRCPPSLADAILIYTPTQQRSTQHTHTHTHTHTKICNNTQRILFVPLLCTDRFLRVLSLCLSLSLFLSLFLFFYLRRMVSCSVSPHSLSFSCLCSANFAAGRPGRLELAGLASAGLSS